MEISAQGIESTSFKELSNAASAIVKTLLYFDIFSYPLNLPEISTNCQFEKINEVDAAQELQKLVARKCIEKQDDFFFIPGNSDCVARRIKGNEQAERKMRDARKMSNFISNFPFVQSVCISGSLSKNYMDDESDIDFFIITTPHRLWICRGMLVLYKKIFLFNSRKHFCINYYLDSDNLEIPDRNIFTATEISFLKPTYNKKIFKKFQEKNAWCREFYPNRTESNFDEEFVKTGKFKRFAEQLLSGFLGEKLDAIFFRMTLNRWKKKFPHFNAEEFDLNLRSRKNVSKHHPRGYQKIVLESYQEKILNFQMQYNVKLQ